jgi:hypothetical protein
LDARHGGSIIDAQIDRALADAPWPTDLLADVASIGTADFDLLDARDFPGSLRSSPPADLPGSLRSSPPADRDIDDSLDLVAIAVRRD